MLVKICGDHWLNAEELQRELWSIPPEIPIDLDLQNEGPSLSALGLLDVLVDYCQKTNRDPSTILLNWWPNSVEKTPFPRSYLWPQSHFFWYSKRYNVKIADATHENRFGMFVGRRTASRMYMLRDMWQNHRDHCLFSLMKTDSKFDPGLILPGKTLDVMIDWVSPGDQPSFVDWCLDPPITSIDDHSVEDQYDQSLLDQGHCDDDLYNPSKDTNLDLLKHYHRFDIEIVIETYAHGECFFPTEKTVRPLVARKPMLIYGPRFFLKRLRDMGFRTWNDYWDESYDDLQGPQRWRAMRDVIDKIIAQGKLIDTEDIARHNFSVLEKNFIGKSNDSTDI